MTPRIRPLLAATVALIAATFTSAQQFNVAVFSQTDGWHHDSIPAGVQAIRELSQLHHFSMFWSEDANRIFNDEQLAKYQAVVFLLTTGNVLNEEQQAAFQRFIRSGGGFVGVHSASDTHYDWEWYTQMVGYMFHIHPAIQTGAMRVENPNFPGMDRFAKRFLFTEEWYEFGPPKSENLNILLTVDERTYAPMAHWGAKQGKGMGDFHPISWYQEYDGGRSFYTALGHLSATYGDTDFRHHLYGGIYWAATGNGFEAED